MSEIRNVGREDAEGGEGKDLINGRTLSGKKRIKTRAYLISALKKKLSRYTNDH